jgi:hypothetical protein
MLFSFDFRFAIDLGFSQSQTRMACAALEADKAMFEEQYAQFQVRNVFTLSTVPVSSSRPLALSLVLTGILLVRPSNHPPIPSHSIPFHPHPHPIRIPPHQNEFERHHAAHEALQTAHRSLLRDREAADSEGAQWPARIQAVRNGLAMSVFALLLPHSSPEWVTSFENEQMQEG